MGLKPLLLALAAKGPADLSKRALAIGRRYGFGTSRMESHLLRLNHIVDSYQTTATLPITASAVEKNPEVIRRISELSVEFALHGYDHIDHTPLTEADQVSALTRGIEALAKAGVRPTGFRAPYLRWSQDTLAAVTRNGLTYDSSQAFHWPVELPEANEGYERVLQFCRSRPVGDDPIVPWISGDLVRIPYSLPDDEALVDRLKISDPERIAEVWLQVFEMSHQRGDLFALGLHPERVDICGRGVETVLTAAGSTRRPVWITHLDAIAEWWKARSRVRVSVARLGGTRFKVELIDPPDARLTLSGAELPNGRHSRNVQVDLDGREAVIRSDLRPIVAVHPTLGRAWNRILSQEGYVTEASYSGEGYSAFADPSLSSGSEAAFLARLANNRYPLVGISRWPRGAQSAVAITGDVDALTLWDYGRRLFGG